MKIQNNKIKNLINSLIKKSNKKLKTPKNSKKLYNEVDVVRNNFNYIKKEVLKSKKAIKIKTSKIKDDIKSQENELKFLYEKKKNLLNAQIINKQNKLINNNKKETFALEQALHQINKKLKKTSENNRFLHTSNNDLKNTVGRYISNSKKLQNENIELSNELSIFQDKYNAIKKKIENADIEKKKIFNRILDLNNSVNKKKDKVEKAQVFNEIKKKKINDVKNNNLDLDQQISNIFRN